MKNTIPAVLLSAALFLSLAPPSASAASSTVQTAKVVYGVNFRTQPALSSNIIRMLPIGESLTILEKTNSAWYRVKDSKGQIGYVSTLSKYLTLSSTSSSTGSSSAGTAREATIEKVIAYGMKYLGTPYQWGSDRSTDTTFDCSDFVRWIYLKQTGIKLPYGASGQGSFVKAVGKTTTDWTKLKRGTSCSS
ncbi:SH3 domain-containing protein [Paenibacillus sp. CC-CFT747]|nr:SH3 domain-containing protein [Paenibacillus sp. CC-CFT747]